MLSLRKVNELNLVNNKYFTHRHYLAYWLSRSILIGLILFTLAAPIELPKEHYLGEAGLAFPFTAFDSEHYLSIAKHGYTQTWQYAFFPFYPFMIRLLNMIGIPYVWAGLLLSWSCSFFATYLIKESLPEDYQKQGIMVWLFSPITIFLSSLYTESVFLFLCLFSWYLFQRQKYLLTGVILGFSILTRNIGVIWGAVLLLLALKKGIGLADILKLFLPVALIGGIYPLYLLIKTGNPLMFISVQSLYWNRQFAFPWTTFTYDFMKFSTLTLNYQIQIIINYVAVLTVIILSLFWFKREPALAIFLLMGSFVPLSSALMENAMPASVSLFRYIFGLFPVYLLLPQTWNSKIGNRLKFLFQAIFYGMITQLFVLKAIF